jgi:hypothetical protein
MPGLYQNTDWVGTDFDELAQLKSAAERLLATV